MLEEQRRLSEKEHIDRLRPALVVTLDVRSHLLVWRHRWLTLANIGGHAYDVRVSYQYHVQAGSTPLVPQGFELKINQHIEWDIGDIGDARGSDELRLEISLRDQENRKYAGEIHVPLHVSKWIPVSLRSV